MKIRTMTSHGKTVNILLNSLNQYIGRVVDQYSVEGAVLPRVIDDAFMLRYLAGLNVGELSPIINQWVIERTMRGYTCYLLHLTSTY